MLASHVYPELMETINGWGDLLLDNPPYSGAERRDVRQALSEAISDARQNERVLDLNFICTHNSRRSQIAQVWAMVAAAWHSNDFIRAFSGGTEVTALHPNVNRALAQTGFRIEREADRQLVYFSEDYPPVVCWSKLYDDPTNPTKDFMAIMVCDDADANCPFIPAAKKRISMRYTDPKFSDGTKDESATYARTVREIGAELFSLFGR